MLAKISLGLRKIRNHRENFAILAKFSLCENFARLAKFRYLAKFTVPSEKNPISLSHQNFARLATFR